MSMDVSDVDSYVSIGGISQPVIDSARSKTKSASEMAKSASLAA